MEKLVFECETITPMFLGGADGNAELRPPSIKAALRFWWRALNGGLPLEQLKRQEAEIFGGSGDNEGKSKFSIRVENSKIKPSQRLLKSFRVPAINHHSISISILDYLTFGPCSYNKTIKSNEYNRTYIDIGSKFDLVFSYDNNLINKTEIFDLLFLVSCIGGLGAKSRNGFGRFIIKNDEITEDYFANLLSKIKKIKNDIAEFTAFSKDVKIYRTKVSGATPLECLKDLGTLYLRGRESVEGKHIYKLRQYIASPIIVNKRTESILERHAKLHFMTVIKEKNEYFGYIFFLPYLYCSQHPAKAKTKSSDFTLATNKLNNHFKTNMTVIL